MAFADEDTITIKGKIINVARQEGVAFANVAVKGTSIGTVSNFKGEFVIELASGRDFMLMASCVGYKPISVSVNSLSAKSIIIEMTEDLIGLEQIVVTADRNKISRKNAPVVVNSIGTQLLQQTAASTMADGLMFSPGLRVENDCSNCGFSQVRMNGLEGPYTQILINSRPIFSGLAGVYGLEHIPPSMIQRIEIVRGGGSALFGGNAIAGTINVITKDPVNNSFTVGSKFSSVGLGVNSSDKASQDIIVDFNGSVVSEDRQSGVFLFGLKRNRGAWDANNDGFSDIVKLKNISAGFNAFHRFSDFTKLSAEYHTVSEYRRGGDNINLPAHMSLIAEQIEHDINSGSLVLDKYFNADKESKLSVYASAQNIDRKSYYGAAQLLDDKDNFLSTPIYDNSSYGVTDDFALSTGIQYFAKLEKLFFAPADIVVGLENVYNTLVDKKLSYYDLDDKKVVPTTLIADQTSNTTGFFAQSKWDFGFGSFLLGARLDSYNIKNNDLGTSISDIVISPRANILFKLTDDMQLRLSYAKGFRAPQIFDEDLHIEASAARRVTHVVAPNLKPESSNSYTMSYDVDKTFGDMQTYFLIEGFYTDLTNTFHNVYGDLDGNGNLISTRKNVKGAVVKGLNMEFKLAPSYKFDFQMGMTIQDSKYKEAVDNGDKNELITDKMLRSPDTYGYFAANWKPLHEFTTTLSANYSGSMDLVHLGSVKNEAGLPVGDTLEKSGDFMDIGLNMAYHFDLGDEVKLEFNFGMKNIFNSYQKNFDSGAFRDAGWVYGPLNPRTLYFGIKIGNLL